MQFHLRINFKSIRQFNEQIFKLEGDDKNWVENQLMIEDADRHTRVITVRSNSKTGWLIGDPIVGKVKKESLEKCLEESGYTKLLQTINGHYRLIVFDRTDFSLSVSSSLFGILPVYYHLDNEMVYVSTNSRSISNVTGQTGINKRFILENVLFYYQLFNETAYQNIKRIPANHVLNISDKGIRFIKHTNISDWFVQNPKPWKRSAGEMSDLFIERVQDYLPNEPYVHALTGGFDGRTLVACGLYHQRNFETYSFGNELSEDTRIAAKLCSIAGLKFNLVPLDHRYVADHSLPDGLEFIINSEGHAGFARAHYLFSCKLLSKNTNYLVTGNFGSEIFRAAHNAGAVISNNLYHLFNAVNIDEGMQRLRNSPEFNWLNREEMAVEWDELRSDISTLPVFSNTYPGMSQNEKFYLFVFEEVFRKYFGPEMVNQFHYMNNRTPFLDIQFLKELLQTRLAGVYSDFFEKNPFNRFKGQVLYAHLIRKAYPAYNEILTDKGYRPKDLFSPVGKFYIAKNYFRKKLMNPGTESDPNSVRDAFVYNRSFHQQQPVDPAIFNVKKFKESLESKQGTHDFLIALSQSWFFNSRLEPNQVKSKACFQQE